MQTSLTIPLDDATFIEARNDAGLSDTTEYGTDGYLGT